MALDCEHDALAAHQRGGVRGLAAWRRAEVQHRLARARIQRVCHEHRRARLREEGAPPEEWRAVHVEGPLQHDRLGEEGVPVAGHRQLPRERGGVAHQREGARALDLDGLHVVGDVTRQVGGPVQLVRLHQVEEEDEVPARDRLPVRPLVGLERDRDLRVAL